MTNEQLKEKILRIASNAEVAEGKQYLEATIPAGRILSLAKTLKESEDTAFDYLYCLSGVDYGDHFALLYHLTSSVHNHSLVIRTKISGRENPSAESVYSIWKTAEYHEREIFDLLGISFRNHPDLRRIFLDDSWQGYPLRKDYTDDVNIVER